MIWKNIENFNGKYQVSDNGLIRSTDRVIKYKNGAKRFIKGTLLIQSNSCGYKSIGLYDNRTKTFRVHRLVSAAFLGDITGLEINHKNGIKDDNRVENLEIVTCKENINHAYKVLNRTRSKPMQGRKGSLNPKAKSVVKIDPITFEIICSYGSLSEAAISEKINNSSLSLCCNRKIKTIKGFIWRFSTKSIIIN